MVSLPWADYSEYPRGWQQKFPAEHPSAVEKRARLHYNSAMSYKVVEIGTVTDDEIERIVNEWTAKGYEFASIHFVTTQASRRPVMAFLFFAGPDDTAAGAAAGGKGA